MNNTQILGRETRGKPVCHASRLGRYRQVASHLFRAVPACRIFSIYPFAVKKYCETKTYGFRLSSCQLGKSIKDQKSGSGGTGVQVDHLDYGSLPNKLLRKYTNSTREYVSDEHDSCTCQKSTVSPACHEKAHPSRHCCLVSRRWNILASLTYAESVIAPTQLSSGTGEVIATLDTFLGLPLAEYNPTRYTFPFLHRPTSHLTI